MVTTTRSLYSDSGTGFNPADFKRVIEEAKQRGALRAPGEAVPIEKPKEPAHELGAVKAAEHRLAVADVHGQQRRRRVGRLGGRGGVLDGRHEASLLSSRQVYGRLSRARSFSRQLSRSS